jgi:hypothetical protein
MKEKEYGWTVTSHMWTMGVASQEKGAKKADA